MTGRTNFIGLPFRTEAFDASFFYEIVRRVTHTGWERASLSRVIPVADEGLIRWLLDSDPAIRWQVERDLTGAPREVWEATRERIATEGFGKRLLALQDPDGQWAGGSFF